jgi:hypothetical protein
MPRPEHLLNIHSRVAESALHPTLAVPVRFHADALTDARMFETDTQIMGGQLLPLFDAGQAIIDYDKIIPIALHSLDNPAFLTNTLAKLGNRGEVQSVDVCNLQMGTFAIHLLYTVQTSAGPSHFVSYVSRFDRDSKIQINNIGTLTGTHAEADFRNLEFLHERFSKQNEQVQHRYGVVQPLAFDYVSQFGKEFGVYTTAFEDLGELHVSARALNATKEGGIVFTSEVAPFYYYGSPIDQRMKYENDILKRNVDDAVRKYDTRGKAKPEAIPQYVALIKQQRELALANAIVYLVGDSHYPADVTINAGDWMVDFHHAKLGAMKLVTTRGAMVPMDDKGWIDMMYDKKEKDIFPSGDFFYKPYAQLTRWDLRTILDHARQLTGKTT